MFSILSQSVDSAPFLIAGEGLMGKYVSVTANEGGRTRTDGSNHQVTSMLRLFLLGMVAPWSNGWVGTQSPSFWGPVLQFSSAIVVLFFCGGVWSTQTIQIELALGNHGRVFLIK